MPALITSLTFALALVTTFAVLAFDNTRRDNVRIPGRYRLLSFLTHVPDRLGRERANLRTPTTQLI